mgnify:CR=1 FL=1
MYAVVDDRNQQYRVTPGDRIEIHLRRDASEGDTVTFATACRRAGPGPGRLAAACADGAPGTAEVVRQVKGPKVMIGKFRRRKNSRRKNGFRARYTVVQIEAIHG